MSHLARAVLIAAFLGILAIPTHSAAAQPPPRYTLVDLGTFGGHSSYLQWLTDSGIAVGVGETTTPDPYCSALPFVSFDSNCQLAHGFTWQNGRRTELQALPGADGSWAGVSSENGRVVGFAENGLIDPLTSQPEFRAVYWQGTKAIDLGTFGGSYSLANGVNDRGQIIGVALNAIPDQYGASVGNPCCASAVGAQQNRAFLWQNGRMQDLGTLGGNDANALLINERGQIAGSSYTNTTHNPVTKLPTMDPFIWEHGVMRDLGTLGGDFGYPVGMNNAGQVAGTSNLAGDLISHAYIWSGGKMIDLGTLGGNNSTTYGFDQAGQVTGSADLPGSKSHDAFIWKPGTMTDLGLLPGYPCSNARGSNPQGQVVGDATDCKGTITAILLWQNGSVYDLNTLIAPNAANIKLTEIQYINNRGEILANGTFPNGDVHAVVLEPTHRFTAAYVSIDWSAGASTSASFTVRFDSAAAGQGQVLFGSGPGCTGLVETATQDQGAGSMSHTVQVQGNDMPGTVGDNGIIPGATYSFEVITTSRMGTEIDNNGGKCYSVTVPAQ